MSSAIETAAKEYIRKGWTPIAQGNSPDGRVGRLPIFKGWNKLSINHPDLRRQGWVRASGIGLVLGRASTGLCAIDIDDGDFARAIFAKLSRAHRGFTFQWSPSGAGHLFFREVEPSFGGPRKATWEGREIHVDLKTNFHGPSGEPVGSALTVYPTPGYIWATQSDPPLVETLEKAWDAVCLAMGAVPTVQASNYNEPWRSFVEDGTRNQSLYTEARALAMARMPYDRAVELLKANATETYARDIENKEFIDTVRSAYRRFWPKDSIATDPRYAR